MLLKPDLEAAGIPYVDDAGRYADFHGLRHSFITHLGRTPNVHFKTAQDLARHSTPVLTARYSHGFKGDEVAAVNALPDFSHPEREAQQATGTENASPSRLARCLAQLGGQEETQVDRRGLNDRLSLPSSDEENPAFPEKNPENQHKTSGEGGIRTHGTASRTPVFETGPFSRSGTSPSIVFIVSHRCFCVKPRCFRRLWRTTVLFVR